MKRIVPSLAALLLLPVLGCSPDLREELGPIVPFPNVQGTVVRAGAPAEGLKVRLLETATDSARSEDRTAPDGRYAFSEVGAGEWTLEARSNDPADFSSVTYPFAFGTPDTSLEAPPLEMSLRGLALGSPADGDTLPVASPAAPLTFSWIAPQLPPQVQGVTIQVRVYDGQGDPVWYSEKVGAASVRWNGLQNRGSGTNRPASPGAYSWKLRMEIDGSVIEWTTSRRSFLFSESI
ncbi:MAG: carboxypeptidase-like regulatory domain-containing protein, partial [Candidatus Eisenbacteria bacterium]|nr:carboxypeptidase-like regulatory domain-containing protein [Candidatus Eisenbacteria bacterium]